MNTYTTGNTITNYEKIPSFTFCNNNMSELIVPNGITHIGSYAYLNCPNLKKVIIPPSISSIEENTFANCKSLSEVFLPATIKEIKAFAFLFCTSLATIHYGGTLTEWNSINKQDGWDYGTKDITIKCTDN